jgi:serine/threonine-protein kinase
VILWEALVGERLHQGITEAAMLTNILRCDAPLITVALADRRAEIPAVRWEQMLALEPLIDRALAREPTDRFATAAGMEEALLEAVPRLSAAEVGAWTRELGKDFLVGRNALLAHEEVSWRRRHGNLESGTRIIVGQPAELPAVQADVITVASDAGGASCASGALPVVELPRRRPPPWFWGGLLLLGATCVSSVFAIDRHVSQALPGATPSALSPAVLPESPVLPSAEASQVVPQTPSVEPIRILVPRAALTRGRAVAPAAPRRTPSEQAGGTLSSPAAPVDLDCVPPFYFEGKKKLYKPGCI